MADFCNVCSERIFGEDVQPDFDVEACIRELERGEIYKVLCEGCAMIAIEKDLETGDILFITTHDDSDKVIVWTYEQWKNGEMTNRFI